jgi:HEAT repeat protein
MAIRALLQGGDRRSKGRADALAADALDDPGLVAELVEALLDPNEIVRLRAADALGKASSERPEVLAPHAAALLGPIADLEQHEVRWHIAQMLPRLALGGARLRRAVKVLAATLESESRIARVLAMDALVQLGDRDRRLRGMAGRAVARALGEGSPAEQARARKLVKRHAWLGAFVARLAGARASRVS